MGRVVVSVVCVDGAAATRFNLVHAGVELAHVDARDLADAVARAQLRGAVVAIAPSSLLRAALEAGADEVVLPTDDAGEMDRALCKARTRAEVRAARDAKLTIELARADGAALELLGGAIANALVSPLASASLNVELLRESLAIRAPVEDAIAAALESPARDLDRDALLAARASVPQHTELDQILDDVMIALKRSVTLVREAAALAGVANAGETSDARVALERVDALMRGTVEKVAEFRVALPAASASVAMPRWQLVQALAALLSNAHRAVVAGGRRGVIELRAQLDRDALSIDVVDDGVGMSEEQRARVFDPFFTTRGRGALGLGLTLAAARARQCGGTLELSSERDQGTRARLRLPLVSRSGQSR